MLSRVARHLLLAGLAAVGVARGDWPAARGNGGRTSATGAEIPSALVEAWTWSTPAPSPAWPGEARGSLWQHITNSFTARAADDLAPVPILAGGLVLVATTHDEVRAMDRRTGALRWRHFRGGPVRFAPAVAGGRVFVGSDDGTVQSLDLATGAPVWNTRIGPDRPLIAGNGRLISPCPVRTGLLVSDGLVYVAAGLFPLEGTYLAALDARDGRVVWRRHLGSLSPQGYLADAGTEIIVPLGRASPKRYRKRDGAYVRDVTSASGTFAVVSDGETLSGPGATGQFAAGDLRSGAKLVSFPGRQLAVTADSAYLVNGFELIALDRRALREHRGALDAATRWKADCGGGAALLATRSRVVAGARDHVVILNAANGAVVQSLSVPSPVAALAADDAGVVAVTRDGTVRAYLEASAPTASVAPAVALAAAPEDRARVEAWVRRLPSPRGLALWTGTTDPRKAVAALLAASEWQVIAAVPGEQAEALRSALADSGWLGTRAAVVPLQADGRVPIADRLFNLVVADGLPEPEALRLACPSPSGLLVRGDSVREAPADPTAGAWTHLYGTAGNRCASSQPLAGHPALRWFGGHGPERMPDRHTRGHAPLAAGGVQVSLAENGLIATDARNGTVRWNLDLPECMRYAMPYDAGYAALASDGSRLHIAVNAELWEVDTRSGRVAGRHPVPVPGLHWGWVALDGNALYGSAESAGAPRTQKEYELVDLDYRSERPLVCSRAVFRSSGNGKTAWIREVPGLLVNPTLAAESGRVYAVEARGTIARRRAADRLTCEQILEDAWVVCLDGTDGRLLWEQPLRWEEARDILGLAVAGDRILLSAARSVGEQAEYRLRCWSAAEGRPLWESRGRNPVKDLYHGQQVKRPVVLGDRVSFESDLFELGTGRRWTPPGAGPDWILSRPGHACGGMTGGRDGLLFRADNPTLFRLSDGAFTRLSPTRPGCWLNILPAECGVLIPEASASCICEYPIQTSMGFAFSDAPAPRLPDLGPEAP